MSRHLCPSTLHNCALQFSADVAVTEYSDDEDADKSVNASEVEGGTSERLGFLSILQKGQGQDFDWKCSECDV